MTDLEVMPPDEPIDLDEWGFKAQTTYGNVSIPADVLLVFCNVVRSGLRHENGLTEYSELSPWLQRFKSERLTDIA